MALSISALIVAVAGVGQAVLPEPDVRFALIAGIPANVARMLLLLGSAVYSRYTYRYEHRQETRQRSRQRLGMLMLQLLEQTGGGVQSWTRKGCSPRRDPRFPTGPRLREREQLLGATCSSSGADGAAPLRRELPGHLHAIAHHGAALDAALTDVEARAIRQMATGTYLLLSKRGG